MENGYIKGNDINDRGWNRRLDSRPIQTHARWQQNTEKFYSKARVSSRSTASPSLWSSLRFSASRYDRQSPPPKLPY